MYKVYQNVYDREDEELGLVGECFRACIASILDKNINDIPHFVAHGRDWWKFYLTWLAYNGMCLARYFPPNKPEGYSIMNGKSPRGEWKHAVVAFNGELFHDPSPYGGGVETVTDYYKMIPIHHLKGKTELPNCILYFGKAEIYTP